MATVIAAAAPACDRQSDEPPRGLSWRFASGRRGRQEIDELLDVGALATQTHHSGGGRDEGVKGKGSSRETDSEQTE
jgi:hypothetical protein